MFFFLGCWPTSPGCAYILELHSRIIDAQQKEKKNKTTLLLSPFSLSARGFPKLSSTFEHCRAFFSTCTPNIFVSSHSSLLCVRRRMAERLRPVNIVRIRPKLAIVLTSFLISLAVEGRAKELDKNNGIMLPDKEQQVFTALANISVTCIFIHTAEIKWNIPDYLTKTPGVK